MTKLLKVAGTMAVATTLLVAAVIALTFYVVQSKSADGRFYGTIGGYRMAVQRAVFLDDETRRTRPEIPTSLVDTTTGFRLCVKQDLDEALKLGTPIFKPPCEIVLQKSRAAETAAMAGGNINCDFSNGCMALDIDEHIYADFQLKTKIDAALLDPCSFFLPLETIRAMKERARTPEGRALLDEQFSKYVSDHINNLTNASSDFACEKSRKEPRKIVLRHGSQISILTTAVSH